MKSIKSILNFNAFKSVIFYIFILLNFGQIMPSEKLISYNPMAPNISLFPSFVTVWSDNQFHQKLIWQGTILGGVIFAGAALAALIKYLTQDPNKNNTNSQEQNTEAKKLEDIKKELKDFGALVAGMKTLYEKIEKGDLIERFSKLEKENNGFFQSANKQVVDFNKTYVNSIAKANEESRLLLCESLEYCAKGVNQIENKILLDLGVQKKEVNGSIKQFSSNLVSMRDEINQIEERIKKDSKESEAKIVKDVASLKQFISELNSSNITSIEAFKEMIENALSEYSSLQLKFEKFCKNNVVKYEEFKKEINNEIKGRIDAVDSSVSAQNDKIIDLKSEFKGFKSIIESNLSAENSQIGLKLSEFNNQFDLFRSDNESQFKALDSKFQKEFTNFKGENDKKIDFFKDQIIEFDQLKKEQLALLRAQDSREQERLEMERLKYKAHIAEKDRQQELLENNKDYIESVIEEIKELAPKIKKELNEFNGKEFFEDLVLDLSKGGEFDELFLLNYLKDGKIFNKNNDGVYQLNNNELLYSDDLKNELIKLNLVFKEEVDRRKSKPERSLVYRKNKENVKKLFESLNNFFGDLALEKISEEANNIYNEICGINNLNEEALFEFCVLKFAEKLEDVEIFKYLSKSDLSELSKVIKKINAEKESRNKDVKRQYAWFKNKNEDLILNLEKQIDDSIAAMKKNSEESKVDDLKIYEKYEEKYKKPEFTVLDLITLDKGIDKDIIEILLFEKFELFKKAMAEESGERKANLKRSSLYVENKEFFVKLANLIIELTDSINLANGDDIVRAELYEKYQACYDNDHEKILQCILNNNKNEFINNLSSVINQKNIRSQYVVFLENELEAFRQVLVNEKEKRADYPERASIAIKDKDNVAKWIAGSGEFKKKLNKLFITGEINDKYNRLMNNFKGSVKACDLFGEFAKIPKITFLTPSKILFPHLSNDHKRVVEEFLEVIKNEEALRKENESIAFDWYINDNKLKKNIEKINNTIKQFKEFVESKDNFLVEEMEKLYLKALDIIDEDDSKNDVKVIKYLYKNIISEDNRELIFANLMHHIRWADFLEAFKKERAKREIEPKRSYYYADYNDRLKQIREFITRMNSGLGEEKCTPCAECNSFFYYIVSTKKIDLNNVDVNNIKLFIGCIVYTLEFKDDKNEDIIKFMSEEEKESLRLLIKNCKAENTLRLSLPSRALDEEKKKILNDFNRWLMENSKELEGKSLVNKNEVLLKLGTACRTYEKTMLYSSFLQCFFAECFKGGKIDLEDLSKYLDTKIKDRIDAIKSLLIGVYEEVQKDKVRLEKENRLITNVYKFSNLDSNTLVIDDREENARFKELGSQMAEYKNNLSVLEEGKRADINKINLLYEKKNKEDEEKINQEYKNFYNTPEYLLKLKKEALVQFMKDKNIEEEADLFKFLLLKLVVHYNVLYSKVIALNIKKEFFEKIKSVKNIDAFLEALELFTQKLLKDETKEANNLSKELLYYNQLGFSEVVFTCRESLVSGNGSSLVLVNDAFGYLLLLYLQMYRQKKANYKEDDYHNYYNVFFGERNIFSNFLYMYFNNVISKDKKLIADPLSLFKIQGSDLGQLFEFIFKNEETLKSLSWSLSEDKNFTLLHNAFCGLKLYPEGMNNAKDVSKGLFQIIQAVLTSGLASFEKINVSCYDKKDIWNKLYHFIDGLLLNPDGACRRQRYSVETAKGKEQYNSSKNFSSEKIGFVNYTEFEKFIMSLPSMPEGVKEFKREGAKEDGNFGVDIFHPALNYKHAEDIKGLGHTKGDDLKGLYCNRTIFLKGRVLNNSIDQGGKLKGVESNHSEKIKLEKEKIAGIQAEYDTLCDIIGRKKSNKLLSERSVIDIPQQAIMYQWKVRIANFIRELTRMIDGNLVELLAQFNEENNNDQKKVDIKNENKMTYDFYDLYEMIKTINLIDENAKSTDLSYKNHVKFLNELIGNSYNEKDEKKITKISELKKYLNELLDKEFNTGGSKGHFIFNGAPGTGKSAFLPYALKKFVNSIENKEIQEYLEKNILVYITSAGYYNGQNASMTSGLPGDIDTILSHYNKTSILFILFNECDVLIKKKEPDNEDKAAVDTNLTSIDDSKSKTYSIFGTTNLPKTDITPAVYREGRFNLIEVPAPSREALYAFLQANYDKEVFLNKIVDNRRYKQVGAGKIEYIKKLLERNAYNSWYDKAKKNSESITFGVLNSHLENYGKLDTMPRENELDA